MGGLVTKLFGSDSPAQVNSKVDVAAPTKPVSAQAFTFNLNADAYIAMVRPVQIGQSFQAFGSENPTTGYVWQVSADYEGQCGPKGAITYEAEYKQDPNPQGMMGVGGKKTINFKVNSNAKVGSICQIRFGLEREGDLVKDSTTWGDLGLNEYRSVAIQITSVA